MFCRLRTVATSSRHDIPLTCATTVPDGDYVLTPNIRVLLRSVAVPHTIVTIADNCVFLPVINFGSRTEDIQEGLSPGNASPIDDTAISVLGVPSSAAAPCCPIGSAAPDPGIFSVMIAHDLLLEHAAKICGVLVSNGDMFELEDPPLGQTSILTHKIKTSDAGALCRRHYRVSDQNATLSKVK